MLLSRQPGSAGSREFQNADWIVDLGPEGGTKGGEIVARGTPEEVTQNPRSYLKPLLEPKKVEKLKPMAKKAERQAAE